MAVGCVHGRAMPLCGVGATGRVHAMNFGTWMVMNDTADASTHLAMKRRHGDRRRLLARDSNHGQGQRPGSSPAGCRREPPCQPPRAAVSRSKTNDNPPGRQIVPHHRALAPPRNTTAQHAITPSGREKHNHHPRQQQPATATTTHVIHLTGTATPPTSRPPAPQQRQRKTQPPPTPTATSNRHHNPHHSPHRRCNATQIPEPTWRITHD